MKLFGVRLIIVWFSCLFSAAGGVVSAQVITVTDELGDPLIGAHVGFLSGSGGLYTTLITDSEGTISSIPTPPSAGRSWSIRIRYLGYLPLEASYEMGTSISFALKPDQVTLNQVVITGQHAANNPEKAVQRVRIIDRKRIEAQAAVNLKDVLRNEMNIRVGQDNILGSTMSLQGMSGQNVKILIDGVPVIGRMDGNIDLSQINLANVERVEIVEGPLAVNYGTDALSGTINIITRKDQDEPLEGTVNTYGESVGQYNIDGRVGYTAGPHLLSVNGGRNYFDGWTPGDAFLSMPGMVPSGAGRSQQWNPKEQLFGGIQYRFNTERLSIRPFADWFYEEVTNRGEPREPYFDNAFDDRYRTWRTNAGFDIRAEFDSVNTVSVLAAFNRYDRIKNTYLKDLTTLDEVLTESPEDQDSTRFDVFMSRGSWINGSEVRNWSLELGYDINHETATGKRIGSGWQTQGDYALFSTMEWSPLTGLLIKPGIRATYNTAYNAPVIPSLNARYKFNNLTFRASWARGFRAPTLKELYFEFIDINHFIVGNETLQAETSDNYSAQAVWQKVYGQKIIKVEWSAFYNEIENLITLAQTGEDATMFSYVNIGDFKSMGAVSNIEMAMKHLKVSAGISYTGRNNSIADQVASNGYVFSPEIRGNILYDWHSTGLTFGAFYKYNGPLPSYALDEAEEVIITTIDGYHMLDLTLSRNFWNDHITLTIGGKNLLNVVDVAVSNGSAGGTHSSSAGTVPLGWGRSVSLGIRYNI